METLDRQEVETLDRQEVEAFYIAIANHPQRAIELAALLEIVVEDFEIERERIDIAKKKYRESMTIPKVNMEG